MTSNSATLSLISSKGKTPPIATRHKALTNNGLHQNLYAFSVLLVLQLVLQLGNLSKSYFEELISKCTNALPTFPKPITVTLICFIILKKNNISNSPHKDNEIL